MHRTTPGEAAFTMIEVIVSLILTTVLLIMLFSAVFDTFHGSERTAQRQKAERAAFLATEMLTDDLRAARAPDRDPKSYGTVDALRGMILQGEPSPGFGVAQIHDITIATPTTLAFYADRSPNSPGPECVTWYVEPSTKALIRAVDPGLPIGCGVGVGSISKQQVMVAPELKRATAKSKVPDPFSYRLQVQPNPIDPDPNLCVDGRVLSPLPGPVPGNRDQIVGVVLELRSFVANRNAHGDQDFRTEVSIPSRQGLDYRYALGCAD